MATLIIIILCVLLIATARSLFIAKFKMSYYEAKLNNRDVDISKVENITIADIIRLG